MNESDFVFEADVQAKSFAMKIARTMVRLFEIPLSEAIGRINRQWDKVRIVGPDIVYHEDEEFWAKTIYYENGTYWWIEEWMAKNEPTPKSYS